MDPDLCERVKANLRDKLPFFQLADAPEQIPEESCLFSWRVRGELTAYLLFYRISRRGRFKVDAAWSAQGRYPANLLPMNVRDNEKLNIPADNPNNGEFRFPVSDLWDFGEDQSWRVEKSSRGNDLEGVVQKICSYFVPYIRQLDLTRPGGWSSK